MSTLHSIIVIAVGCLFFTGEDARARDLTESEARNLVLVSLGKEVVVLPHFGLDAYEDKTAEGFYVFEATAEHPNGGSPVIGQFAVNKATGDVWRLGVCERVRSKPLSRAQTNIRKKIGVNRENIRRLTAKAPCQP